MASPIQYSWGYNQITTALSGAVGLGNGTSQLNTSQVITVNAGGSGYAVGDFVSVNASGGANIAGLQANLYITSITPSGPFSTTGAAKTVSLSYGSSRVQPGLYITANVPTGNGVTVSVVTTYGVVSTSGSGLTVNISGSPTANAVPSNATFALIQASTLGSQNLLWRDDGVAPTSTVGNIINSGDSILYPGILSNILLIYGGNGGIADIQFFSYT